VSMRRNEGLDSTPSVAPAPTAGWAARGFVIELLARASRLEQRRVAAKQRAAVMGRHGAP
jgi:hypothetical protein